MVFSGNFFIQTFGRQCHSVKQLEEICEQFKEFTHQQQIVKQNCMKHIIELKFGVVFS